MTFEDEDLPPGAVLESQLPIVFKRDLPPGAEIEGPVNLVNEAQHPRIGLLDRLKAMGGRVTSGAVAARALHDAGWETLPLGGDEFAVRMPGETEWFMPEPRSIGAAFRTKGIIGGALETVGDVLEFAPDVVEGTAMGLGGALGLAGGTAVGGPGGGVAGTLGGAGVGAGVARSGLQALSAGLLGTRPTLGEAAEASAMAVPEGMVGEALGRYVAGPAMRYAGRGVKRLLHGKPIPSSAELRAAKPPMWEGLGEAPEPDISRAWTEGAPPYMPGAMERGGPMMGKRKDVLSITPGTQGYHVWAIQGAKSPRGIQKALTEAQADFDKGVLDQATYKRILGWADRRMEELGKAPKFAEPETPPHIQASLERSGKVPLAAEAVPEPGGGMRATQVPVSEIKVDPETYQFKTQVNEAGIEKALEGGWDPGAAGNVVLHRRADGSLWVVNGHHRVELARRKGVEWLNAQILDEGEGWTVENARKAGALWNIMDEKGRWDDYARFFRNARMPADEARKQGLLAGAKAKTAWVLAEDAGDDLFAAAVGGKVDPEVAAAIARAAPKDTGLQYFGLKYALERKLSPHEAEGLIGLRKAKMPAQAAGEQQLDLFAQPGMEAEIAEELSTSKAARGIITDLQRRRELAHRALRDKAAAQELGINVNDPKALATLRADLDQQLGAWEKWYTSKELTAQARSKAGLQSPETPPGISPKQPTATTPQQTQAPGGPSEAQAAAIERHRARTGAAKPPRKPPEAPPAAMPAPEEPLPPAARAAALERAAGKTREEFTAGHKGGIEEGETLRQALEVGRQHWGDKPAIKYRVDSPEEVKALLSKGGGEITEILTVKNVKGGKPSEPRIMRATLTPPPDYKFKLAPGARDEMKARHNLVTVWEVGPDDNYLLNEAGEYVVRSYHADEILEAQVRGKVYQFFPGEGTPGPVKVAKVPPGRAKPAVEAQAEAPKAIEAPAGKRPPGGQVTLEDLLARPGYQGPPPPTPRPRAEPPRAELPLAERLKLGARGPVLEPHPFRRPVEPEALPPPNVPRRALPEKPPRIPGQYVRKGPVLEPPPVRGPRQLPPPMEAKVPFEPRGKLTRRRAPWIAKEEGGMPLPRPRLGYEGENPTLEKGARALQHIGRLLELPNDLTDRAIDLLLSGRRLGYGLRTTAARGATPSVMRSTAKLMGAAAKPAAAVALGLPKAGGWGLRKLGEALERLAHHKAAPPRLKHAITEAMKAIRARVLQPEVVLYLILQSPEYEDWRKEVAPKRKPAG